MKQSSVIVLGLRRLRLILPLILSLCWLITSACTQSSPFITMTLATPDLYSDLDSLGNPVHLVKTDVNTKIGTYPLNDPRLERNRCLFSVDYPHSPNTLFNAYGDPGQSSFNVTLSSPRITAVASGEFPCDPNVVPIPQSLTFQPSPLGLGVRQTVGSFTIETGTGIFGLGGPQPFGRMEFTLTSFDRNKNQAVGDFRFLFQRKCSDPHDAACQADETVLYGVGSFLMPIH